MVKKKNLDGKVFFEEMSQIALVAALGLRFTLGVFTVVLGNFLQTGCPAAHDYAIWLLFEGFVSMLFASTLYSVLLIRPPPCVFAIIVLVAIVDVMYTLFGVAALPWYATECAWVVPTGIYVSILLALWVGMLFLLAHYDRANATAARSHAREELSD